MPLPSEIVLLPFPFTDLSATKRRPVLVLKAGNAQGDFLAVQITSQLGYRPAVRLIAEDFELGGLPKESMVRPDKVFTLNKALIVRRVGKLTPSGFERILDAVCQQVGCQKL
jgi:mRNA interferase MazF